MNPTVFQCQKCIAMWTRQTLLDDACPACGGEVRDITHTHTGQEFLRIIAPPDEVRYSNMNRKTSFASGASNIVTGGKS